MKNKNLEVKWSYELRDGEKIIRAIKPRICKSFLKQFGQILYGCMGGGTAGSIKDTGGTARTNVRFGIYTSGLLAFDAALGNDDYGILVGTGTTAAAIDDYVMETKIIHGTSAGQLQYAACTVGSPSATATQATFRTTRVFTNGTGNSIDVEEIGMGVRTQSSYNFLIIRDVTGGVAVAAGLSLTVNYDLTTTI